MYSRSDPVGRDRAQKLVRGKADPSSGVLVRSDLSKRNVASRYTFIAISALRVCV